MLRENVSAVVLHSNTHTRIERRVFSAAPESVGSWVRIRKLILHAVSLYAPLLGDLISESPEINGRPTGYAHMVA